MLDPWIIYGEKPLRYSLHRVFIVDIDDNVIIFHDPSSDGKAFYKSDIVKFEKTFQINGSESSCFKKLEIHKLKNNVLNRLLIIF